MDPSCSDLHPSSPSIRINNFCLPCLQITISSPTISPTLRRATLAHLFPISANPDQLFHRAPHLLPKFILQCLSAFQALAYPAERAFVTQIASLLVHLACALDRIASQHTFIRLVFAWAADTVVNAPCPTAVCALAEGLKLSQQKDAVLDAFGRAIQGRGAILIENIWQCVHQGFWNDVGSVVCSALRVEHVEGAKVLDAMIRKMSPRGQLECDSVFLKVVLALWEPSALMHCTVFVEVLKRALVAKHVDARRMVTAVIRMLCNVDGFAEWFCEREVFDYVVESVREVGEGRNEAILMRLAVDCMEAIVSPQPEGLELRWCYCLEVVFGVCGRVSEGESVEKAVKVICEGLRGAPVAAVSETALQAFLGLIMSLLMRRSQLEENADRRVDEEERTAAILSTGIKGLSMFLEKYRPSVQVIHSVLEICEASVRPRCLLPQVFALLSQTVQNLKNLANEVSKGKQMHEKNAIRVLAQRILFVIFSSWGEALENTVSIADNVTFDNETVEGIWHALDMFSNGLDPTFMILDSCSKSDRDAICAWCCKHFSPKTVFAVSKVTQELPFHIPPNVVPKTRKDAIRQYLWRITVDEDIEDTDALEDVPTTEDAFREDLVENACRPNSFALKALEKSIKYGCSDLLCNPGLTIEALSAGLQKLQLAWSSQSCSQSLRYLQSICYLCVRYGINFRELNIAQGVWEKVLREGDLVTSRRTDILVFCQFIRRGVVNWADVLAWDRLTKCFWLDGSTFAEKSNLLILTLVESVDASSSILHAVVNSSRPKQISNFLLDACEANKIGLDLIAALKNAGAMNVLRRMLEEIPIVLSDMSTLENICSSQQIQDNADKIIMLRIQSLVSILTPTIFGCECQPDWSLLRRVNETFILISTSKTQSRCAIQLQSAIMRWLIAVLKSTNGKEYCSYACQSDIASHVVQVLQSTAAGQWDPVWDELVSNAASFLVLLLQEDNISSKILNPLITRLLRDTTAWNRLLCYSSCLHTDCSFKVTNCSHLLNYILLRNSLRKTDRVAWCPKVQVLLSAAAFSANVLMREAALMVLGTIMELQSEMCSVTSAFSVHLGLSRCLFAKFCSPSTEPTGAAELRYLVGATYCGHADNYILEVEKEVAHRLELHKVRAEARGLLSPDTTSRILTALKNQVAHRIKTTKPSELVREHMPSKVMRKVEVLPGRNVVVLQTNC